MTTSLIPFRLGKLVLEHDKSADMDLMPGDVVTIFSQSDIQIPIAEQTKYVTIEGEVAHPGIYSVSPGETLRSVVERAGGLTDQAYLLAARFTRKSTRTSEAEALNKLADDLEHQLTRKAIYSIGGQGAGGGTVNQQSLGLSHDLITRLRNTRASGRIVLSLHGENGKELQLPDIHLEDGDRLVVPFKPDTVQVLGSVYNPHAFVFRQGVTAREYLRLAGGPNRDADRKQIFILRADGTASDKSGSGMLRKDLDHTPLNPGDTIVVPEKIMRLSSLAEVLAWTQTLSQASNPAIAASLLAR